MSWYHLGSPRSLRLKSSQVSSHHVFPNPFTPPVCFSAASAAPGPGGPASARVLGPAGPAGADPSARSWDVDSATPNGGAAACDWSSCGASLGDPPWRSHLQGKLTEFPWLSMVTTAHRTANNGRQHTPQWQFECGNGIK